MESVVSEDGSHDLRPGGRWAQWWASWRVAVRMARRDVRRHRGRSTLIALMVGLPVLALVAGAVVLTTGHLDEKEQLPFRLGDAAAAVYYKPGNHQMMQLPIGSLDVQFGTSDKAALPLPPGPSTTASLEELTGGRVTHLVTSRLSIKLKRWQLIGYLGVAPEDMATLGRRVSLVSGRWPTRAGEVLVTEAGVGLGLPRSGSLTVKDEATPGDVEQPVTIVGVGEGFARAYSGVQPAALIGGPMSAEDLDPMGFGELRDEYLVFRAEPVTWEEVQRWNQHGLHVVSRALVNDPPVPAAGMDPVLLSDMPDDVAWAGLAALAGVGLTLLTSLLAGPAFAVTAARQRRTLALAASNGANRAQLRRTVLGQALVLGVGTTMVALVLGIATAWVLVASLRIQRPESFVGPFDIAWAPVGVIVLSAVVSSVVSALVPARGLGKLDIVAVLRGQNVSPRLRRRMPLGGLVLAGAGAALTLWAATTNSPNWMATGSVALVLGVLLIVPLVLLMWAKATAGAPVALRMATRDAARQRGRATPTVAAILAGAAALSAAFVFIASDTALKAKTYDPHLPDGHGRVWTTEPSDKVTALVRSVAPELRVTPLVTLSQQYAPGPGADEVQVVAKRTGCSPLEQTGMAATDISATKHCMAVASMPSADFGRVVGGDPAYLADLMGLGAEDRAFLSSGGMLVVAGPGERPQEVPLRDGSLTHTQGSSQVDVVDGEVTFLRIAYRWGDQGPELASVTDLGTVRAKAVGRDAFARAFPTKDVGAVASGPTLRSVGAALSLDGVSLDAQGRHIAHDEQQAIAEALRRADGDVQVYVERGFQRGDVQVILAVLGIVAFIILVATLIATALSQAEGQATSGTLAAVGATRLTRRNLAAAQAGSLALMGAILGVLVGLVPGVALVRLNAESSYDARAAGLEVVVPWMQLLVPVVVIPLIAAALAWVSIRKHPTVTRRLT